MRYRFWRNDGERLLFQSEITCRGEFSRGFSVGIFSIYFIVFLCGVFYNETVLHFFNGKKLFDCADWIVIPAGRKRKRIAIYGYGF